MSTSDIQSPNFPESRKAGDPLELTLYGVKAIFRYCPPGTFLMGSPVDEKGRGYDETPHEVTLTRGFWLLETPVTQAIWEAVKLGQIFAGRSFADWWNKKILMRGLMRGIRECNPSRFQGMDARPVESVSWKKCDEFIRKLNNAEVAPDVLFDFPTEAEWEYACRAGTTTRYNSGDELTEDDANFAKTFDGTTPVRSFAPNAWGFYDMHGNVGEWCSDWYGVYPKESTRDPQGSKSGSDRVVRGGCWGVSAKYCRSAFRFDYDPSLRSSLIGFRLALRSLN